MLNSIDQIQICYSLLILKYFHFINQYLYKLLLKLFLFDSILINFILYYSLKHYQLQQFHFSDYKI